MTATLAQLVAVRSQLAEAILDYLTRLADILDQTQWMRGGERIKASDIAVEQFVLTSRKRLRSARSGEEREERDAFIEKRSPMDEIDAARYELPTNVEEREEERWRRVIQGGRVRLGLRGAPGSGKTFTTRETMARLAREMAAKLDAQQISLEHAEVFIWTTATALAKASGKAIADAVLDAMESCLQLTFAPHLRTWLQQAIHSSRAFIVVDALDELGTEDVANFTARSQQLNDLPARLIVTCRTMQWETRKGWLGWPTVTEVELSPFKQRQQREFAGKFFRRATDLATSMQRLLQVNYSLRHACTTPLLLTFACWLHEAGSVRGSTSYTQLYVEITRSLMNGEWSSLKTFKPTWANSRVKTERCFHFFEAIAWGLFVKAPARNRFTLEDWEQAADEALPRNCRAPLDAPEFLEQLENVGIIIPAGVDEQRGDRCWSFAHRTLLEFLAANALSRKPQEIWLAEVKQHFWFAAEWNEVLVFLVGLVEDATPLVKVVGAEEDDLFGSMLTLRARLVGAAKKVEVQVAKQVCSDVYAFWSENWQGWMCLREFAAPKWNALAAKNEEAGKVSVNELLELTQNEDWKVRWRVVAALRELGRQEAVARLLELTRDEDVRYIATRAMGRLGGQEAVARLLELTRDEDEDIRVAAATSLGEFGGQEAVARLLELTQDEGRVRWVAVEALGQLGGQEAVARLLELIRDEHLHNKAAEMLGQLGAHEAISRLLELTRDEVDKVRESAVKALGQLGAHEAVSRLLELTRDDEDLPVRWRAVEALGQLGGQEAVARLLELTRDKHGSMRSAAAKALGECGGQEAIARLLELTHDEVKYVCESAAEALGQLGAQEAVSRLLELTRNEDVPVSAAKALGQLGAHEAISRLLELTRDEVDKVRESAVKALGQLGAHEAVSRLLELTRDEVDKVRESAAEALGQLGGQEAVARLLELTRDKNWPMDKIAAAALWKLVWKTATRIRLPRA